jgi:uncharacterized protein (DUF2062 family)
MGKVANALRRRVVEPVFLQLRQGITPSKLALSLALGLVLSALPVLGVTGILCVAVAAALRLNQPAILAANYAATPLQIALYLPFFQGGAWLFGAPSVSFSVAQVRAELAADAWPTIVKYWDANLRAVGAWALVAPLAVALVFALLRPLLARLPVARDATPAPAVPAAAPPEPAPARPA